MIHVVWYLGRSRYSLKTLKSTAEAEPQRYEDEECSILGLIDLQVSRHEGYERAQAIGRNGADEDIEHVKDEIDSWGIHILSNYIDMISKSK